MKGSVSKRRPVAVAKISRDQLTLESLSRDDIKALRANGNSDPFIQRLLATADRLYSVLELIRRTGTCTTACTTVWTSPEAALKSRCPICIANVGLNLGKVKITWN